MYNFMMGAYRKMTFHEQLNDYINQIGCSAKELAAASGLSEATLSRYRSGERIPEENSQQLHKLAEGIAKLASDQSLEGLSLAFVSKGLSDALARYRTVIPWNAAHFNSILTELGINMTELARYLNFDASYLSRVRSGQRIPANPQDFAERVAFYLARRLTDPESKSELAALMTCDSIELDTEMTYIQAVSRFLLQEEAEEENPMQSFLTKINEFDLNEYIRAIKFDELKVPTLPFQLTSSKTYYGLEEIKNAEIDFIKSTVLAKNMDPVFMCADTPMEEMSHDEDFAKKWMFGLAMMLKKGLHINIIHNLDRPFRELMLGLEAWVPMYMTGQIHPYYMEEKHNSLYCHLNYCSGQVALAGESISGHHEDGRYYLTRQKEELAYQQKKCKQILSRAKSLMDIYTKAEASSFWKEMENLSELSGVQYDKLNSLPLFTLSRDLLDQILSHNDLSADEKAAIHFYYDWNRQLYEKIMQNRSVSEEIMLVSQEEFEKYPVNLDLSGAYIEKTISYTYEEYVKHMEQIKNYEETHSNYSYKFTEDNTFRNIQVNIISSQLVIMKKNTAPAIQFVIRHPTLVQAIENFTVPVTD